MRLSQARRHGWDSHKPGDMGETDTVQETWVRQSHARRHGWDCHRDNHRPGDMGRTVIGQRHG